jgi:catecholate siderophore receptor
VQVTGSNNALQITTDLNRVPDTLQSTPQTVIVIPQVMIEQQQATTVDQVLQYVPGITVATGEGNGGINGDQFRIRGFDASGDVYVDGLRDFGSYVRLFSTSGKHTSRHEVGATGLPRCFAVSRASMP